MSLKSSVTAISMGQISSTFFIVASPLYSSKILTVDKFLAATAKCKGVLPLYKKINTFNNNYRIFSIWVGVIF